MRLFRYTVSFILLLAAACLPKPVPAPTVVIMDPLVVTARR